MTRRKRSRNSHYRKHLPTTAVELDVTHEDVISDLDPGWLSWSAETQRSEKRVADRAA